MERNFPLNKRLYAVPIRRTFRGIWPLVGRILLGVWLCASCETSPMATTPFLAPPVNALPQNDLIGQRLIRQIKECRGRTTQTLEKDPVAELLLIYVSSGRDFRPPTGPDGYLLRVIPLNKEYHPISVEAEVTIALYRERDFLKNRSWPDPLRIWQMPRQQIKNHWVISPDLDGYLFRLDWGLQDPGPGNYRFLVRFVYESKNKTITICRAMTFQHG